MIKSSVYPVSPQRCGRTGAAAVEMAVIMPLFLLLLGGIIEFGQAFRVEHALSNVARRGARLAVINGNTTAQVVSKVQTQCQGALGVKSGDIAVTVEINGKSGGDVASAVTGDEVSVTVSVPYCKAAAGFFSNRFSTTSLKGKCTLEHE